MRSRKSYIYLLLLLYVSLIDTFFQFVRYLFHLEARTLLLVHEGKSSYLETLQGVQKMPFLYQKYQRILFSIGLCEILLSISFTPCCQLYCLVQEWCYANILVVHSGMSSLIPTNN